MAKLKATTVAGDMTATGTVKGATIVGNASASNLNTGTVPEARLTKATTGVYGITKLNNATNSTSTAEAATANAVKLAYDRAAAVNSGNITAPKTLGGENLNDVTTPGFYRQQADSNATTARNYPITNAGMLIVTNAVNCQQEYHAYHINRVYVRVKNSTTTWTSWSLMYNTDNKPTLNDLGGTAANATRADRADRLSTARTISLNGDLSGSVSFDGSANVTISAEVKNDSHIHTGVNAKNHTGEQYVRDHGNGNITISAAKNTSGTWGQLYLGYDGTTGVRLEKTMNWKGGATLVDSNGKIPWTNLIGIPTSFNPSSHTHDDRYFTESEADGRYIRRNADCTFSGKIIGNRRAGLYGTYDSYKTDTIWSMGTSYQIEANGANFGNLYGFGYKHTNNTTGGTMAGGHQAVWCSNGTPKSAIGDGIWSSGTINGANVQVGGNNVYHTGRKPSASDVGARPSNWVPTWNDVTSKPGIIPFNGSYNQKPNIDTVQTGIWGGVDQSSAGAKPSGIHNGNAFLTFNTHSGNYCSQIWLNTNANKLHFRNRNSGDWTAWQDIYHSGNKPSLSALGAAASSHTHDDRYTTKNGNAVNNMYAIGNSSNDKANNSPWYGMGTADFKLGGNGNAVQVAGYWGLRLRSSGYILDFRHNAEPRFSTGVFVNGWVRPEGNSGLFFQTHGGGWHMTDSTWIRSYGNKNVYCNAEIKAQRLVTDSTLNGYTIGKSGAYRRIPTIESDGVMEVGQYFDFHHANSTRDYVYRMHVQSSSSVRMYSTGDHNWMGFYRSDNARYGYIGNGSPGNNVYHVVADISTLHLQGGDSYIQCASHLCPTYSNSYWLGTNSPDLRWKGMCAMGGTIGSSDAITKENMVRMDGTQVVVDEKTRQISERQPKNKSSFNKAMPGDYYEFIKDRFKPTYYNYKLSEARLGVGTGGEGAKMMDPLPPEEEIKMLKNIGFVAQDYDIKRDKVAQEFIFENREGELSYNHMSYVTVGMVALQEAIKKIESLEREVKLLKRSLQ